MNYLFTPCGLVTYFLTAIPLCWMLCIQIVYVYKLGAGPGLVACGQKLGAANSLPKHADMRLGDSVGLHSSLVVGDKSIVLKALLWSQRRTFLTPTLCELSSTSCGTMKRVHWD